MKTTFTNAIGSHKEEATQAKTPLLTIGLLTDAHYTDIPNRGDIAHRVALHRVSEAAETFQQVGADFAVQLGDIIDQTPESSVEDQKCELRRIYSEFARFRGETHSVPGNHCLKVLYEAEFEQALGNPIGYRSFDKAGFHFVFLNACYRKDGTPYGRRCNEWFDADIPQHEREWLQADLQNTLGHVVIFTHQRLDAPQGDLFGVHSAEATRDIIEQSGKVIAVFQGHQHCNLLETRNGVAYATLHAVAHDFETNAFSLLNLYEDGAMRLIGFGRHSDHPLVVSPAANSENS
ncbi:alkaline phosphatase [Armatimonadota bacterium]|nr:alkaline phosphatase [Armatimonadota bacterium]